MACLVKISLRSISYFGMSIGYYEYYNIPVGFHETSPITDLIAIPIILLIAYLIWKYCIYD